MMDWISADNRPPTEEDSPILAVESLDYFSTKALQYENGWDGPGWYDANEEYGMGLHESEAFYNEYDGMKYWMPLPNPPMPYRSVCKEAIE
jgi:uncharacterized protein DUF551